MIKGCQMKSGGLLDGECMSHQTREPDEDEDEVRKCCSEGGRRLNDSGQRSSSAEQDFLEVEQFSLVRV